MPIIRTEQEKRDNKIKFILATQDLLDTNNPDELSIRKIAEKAGFHNSTIYLYFEDLDELIAMASLKYFQQYNDILTDICNENLSPFDNFEAIWEVFCACAFSHPHAYYHFFFGKYATDITRIVKQYYDLFPDQVRSHSQDIDDMYYGNSLRERCLRILYPIMNHPDLCIDETNLDMINDITVYCFKEFLEMKMKNPELDNDELYRKFRNMLFYSIYKREKFQMQTVKSSVHRSAKPKQA